MPRPRRAFNDLIGQRVGRWTVLGLSEKLSSNRQAFWKCQCDCGQIGEVRRDQLISGRSQSCGCQRDEKFTRFIHGYARHPVYAAWRKMFPRCCDKEHKQFRHYGGRGIKICERWKSFDLFLADMLPSWKEGLSIDRINNDGDYEPSNCRWATTKEQTRNTRRNVFINTQWGRLVVTDAAEHAGLHRNIVFARIKHGWPEDRLLIPIWNSK